MNKDPYSVLGVSPNASDDEIKAAYRNLVKKYHPDRYANQPDLAEVAKEKMQEVNAAYDEIEKMRKGGASSPGSSYSSGSYSNAGSYSSYSGPNAALYAKVRSLINARQFTEARTNLESVYEGERNAEWNFLMGCVLLGLGHHYDAMTYLDRACDMDPSNAEYRNVRDRASGGRFGRQYYGSQSSDSSDSFGCGCSPCSLCTACYLADCCCECMGSDLIRCC